jgi:hypothetical protein
VFAILTIDMTNATSPLSIWTGQGLHAVGLVFLLVVVWAIWTNLGEPFPNVFWIAVGFNSSAALAVAAFSHAYIWVHFYATEKPDMDFLYSST